MGSYRLRCLECGYVLGENVKVCGNHMGLLRAEYSSKQIMLSDENSVFRFCDWLPTDRTLPTDAAPIAFRNEKMNKDLEIGDVWIGFTGYYPEREAFVRSCSFKEMEALPTLAMIGTGVKMVVASAGNTGRAFAHVSNEFGIPGVVVVPEMSKDRVWVPEDKGMTKMIAVKGDYADAISVAERISEKEGYIAEGGARNIARRDGMGTVMLESVMSMERLPDRYFQAIGSGTGAISAWEASLRLIGDGRFGSKLPELHLSQNSPFTPMKHAWDAGRRKLISEDLGDHSESIPKVYADVLTNRHPPYEIRGGVFDAMEACGGSMYSVTNEEAKEAGKIWLEYESAELDPAAAVAFASLLKASENSIFKGTTLLNITGAGYDRVKEDMDIFPIRIHSTVAKDISREELEGVLNE
jgi:cysteate synthase